VIAARSALMPGSRSATIKSSVALRLKGLRASPRLAECCDERHCRIAALRRRLHHPGTVSNARRMRCRQYGPDRADIAVADGIGLVHVLMRMTPEDQFDRQPWQGASGALITADVRLDNRDEVLERIGTTPGEARAWPDSRVLLAGWEKLGDALWPMLRGPFAVAIWDSRRRALTLARDHLGLNVVMWHKSERFFAFATMPNDCSRSPTCRAN